VELVLWGVQPDIFEAQPDATAALRKRFDPEGEHLIVMALGRMVYKKGFEYLIQAAPSIVEEFPQARIVFVGGGPLLEDMKTLAADLKVEEYIHFVGEVPWTEVPLYDQMCDIFVVPSILDHEGNLDGQPTIIAEAMVCAKPIVASSVAGIPLIIEEGINGLLVQEKDAGALSAAIRKLLASSELRRKMGEANRQKVDTTLNWRNVAHTFDGFFRRISTAGNAS
jgi:glycosyltransferase involved in cell wall biosynthesis